MSDSSNKILPLQQAQSVKRFLISPQAFSSIEELNADIAIPQKNGTPFRIETDASGSATGASLSQSDRPIAYFSRTLSNAEQKQSTVELEAMAVVEAFRKWQQLYVLIQRRCGSRFADQLASQVFSNLGW